MTQQIATPQWMKEIPDMYTRVIMIRDYKADMRALILRDRANPSICDCEGGCDMGIAFSQD